MVTIGQIKYIKRVHIVKSKRLQEINIIIRLLTHKLNCLTRRLRRSTLGFSIFRLLEPESCEELGYLRQESEVSEYNTWRQRCLMLENHLRHVPTSRIGKCCSHLSVWSPLEEFPFEVPLSLWVARYSKREQSTSYASSHCYCHMPSFCNLNICAL